MNLIESILGLANREKKPLHVGEVMSLWKILAAFQDGRTVLLGLLNHTSDPELKRYLESYVSDFEEPWAKRTKQFMQNEGIPLPPAGADKPKADEQVIPEGGKFTDVEIATLTAAKLLEGTQLVQHGLVECLQYDLANLLIELEVACYRQAFVLREIMERRGWLKMPPLWHKNPASE